MTPLALFNDSDFLKGWTDQRRGRTPQEASSPYLLGFAMAAEAADHDLPGRSTWGPTPSMRSVLQAAPGAVRQLQDGL